MHILDAVNRVSEVLTALCVLHPGLHDSTRRHECVEDSESRLRAWKAPNFHTTCCWPSMGMGTKLR